VDEELEALLDEVASRDRERRGQAAADQASAAADAAGPAIEAQWARMFVEELRESFEGVLPQVGLKLGRAINFRVDQVMNPFHETHHDYRLAARLGQLELQVFACEAAVAVEMADLRSGGTPLRQHLGRAELRSADRPASVRSVVHRFVETAVGA